MFDKRVGCVHGRFNRYLLAIKIGTLAVLSLFLQSFVLSVTAQAAIATKEGYYALVIGNGNYIEEKNRLPNAVKDARSMAKALRDVGFNVVFGEDLSWKKTHKIVNDFFASTPKMKVAAFFYAGHAVQIHGSNYLITVDAKLDSGENMVKGLWSMQPLFEDIAARSQTGLLILDSCRNNPFLKQVQTSAHNDIQSVVRSISLIDQQSSVENRGFSQSRGGMIDGVPDYDRVELVSPRRQTVAPPRRLSVSELKIGKGLAKTNVKGNMFIAYATQPGDVAKDGSRGHSPFTEGILKYIGAADLGIEAMFKKVRQYVYKTTNMVQRPWVSASLVDDFYFSRGGVTLASASMGTEDAEIRREPYYAEPIIIPAKPNKRKSIKRSKEQPRAKKVKERWKQKSRPVRKTFKKKIVSPKVRKRSSRQKTRPSKIKKKNKTRKSKKRLVKKRAKPSKRKKKVAKRKVKKPKRKKHIAKKRVKASKPRRRVAKKRKVRKVKTASRRKRNTGGSPTQGFIGF